MKNTLILLLMLALHMLFSRTLPAQDAANTGKLKPFAAWIGRWQGESSMKMDNGPARTAHVDEHVEMKLEGAIMVVEGVGKAVNPTTKQETVVHHAFGVLSYDLNTQEYKFKTYLKDGRGTDAWVKPTGDNAFQWGFDIPNRGKTRYAITIDPVKKTWHETGEFSADGATWFPFMEMNLTRVD
jgi:hypothetical protein